MTHIDMPGRSGWMAQIAATLKLGLPLVGAQLAQLAINTTGVVIIGRLGAVELAGVVLSIQFFFPILHFGSGFSIAIMPIIAQAVGRGDRGIVRRYVRTAIWRSLAYALLVLPLFIYCEPILILMGQHPDVAEQAASYLHIMGFGIAPALIFLVLKSFLSGIGRTKIILAVNLVCVALNAFFAYALTLGHFGFPALGLRGAASVALAVEFLFALGLVAYIALVPDCRAFALHKPSTTVDRAALLDVLRHGLPISLMILSEMGLFSVAAIMIGWIDTLQLAAHGVAMQLVAMAFMVPLGFSQAATVRIGLAVGRSDDDGLLRTGITALCIVAVCSAASGLLFITKAEFLAALFVDGTTSDAKRVIALAIPFITIAGCFQLLDGLQSVGAGLARGLKDTTIPMFIALFSYWVVGFGGAYILAFPLHLGGPGIWYGFVAGLGCAAIALNTRFFILVAAIRRNAVAQILSNASQSGRHP